MIDSAQKVICACPLNGKICSDGIREDFPDGAIAGQKIRCRWWQHVAGKDPQSAKDVDFWDCAVAWLPTTTIEAAQRSHQVGASVDKLANHVAEVKLSVSAMSGAIRVAAAGISQAIEAGALQVMLPSPESGQEPNGHTRELKEGEKPNEN